MKNALLILAMTAALLLSSCASDSSGVSVSHNNWFAQMETSVSDFIDA